MWEGINSILAHKSKRSKSITSIIYPSDSEKVTTDLISNIDLGRPKSVAPWPGCSVPD